MQLANVIFNFDNLYFDLKNLVIHTCQVGMSLAQIGEFAFVLLSRASNLKLIEVLLLLLSFFFIVECVNIFIIYSPQTIVCFHNKNIGGLLLSTL